eukprot:JP435661.1.p1 GENE.JP435661.1~~JP435661.1.p1  ORF type:complete len:779 (+),score=357.63 JP435661.1:132-2339(+)
MSVKEKVGQMTQLNVDMLLKDGSPNELDYEKLKNATKVNKIGSFLNSAYSGNGYATPGGLNVTEWITLINDIQEYVLGEGGMEVPMVYGLDSVHGANYVMGAIMFPHNHGLAATFNLTAAELAAGITAKDTRVSGIPWVFSPVLGVGQQPLWPRFYEAFGEDPFVVTEFGAAVNRGIQGPGLKSATGGAACAKHFMGYPVPRTGKDRTDAWIPSNYFYEYFVPPFKRLFDDGVETVMINSGSINGVPVHASKHYLTGVLRDQLGFKGIAVTDWQDIEKLHTYHKIADSQKKAVAMAVNAGIDMSMVPLDYSFIHLLEENIEDGSVSMERIDESVMRVLRFKHDVGLFEQPYANANSDLIDTVGSEADRMVALDSARQSITLLKNGHEDKDQKPILPLNLGDGSKILVTGPAGTITGLCGGWSIHWLGATSDKEFYNGKTVFQAIKDEVTETNAGIEVEYKTGSEYYHATEEDLADAAMAASKADVVVLVLGEPPEAESVGNINDLTLPKPQLDLYEAVSATGTPVVLVLVEARPRILGPAANSDAIVMAYLPCTEGGEAISDVIFGNYNPSGRLPFTYPQFGGDIDVYYHKPWGYYSQGTHSPFHVPLYDFGHGLSYTTFEYPNGMDLPKTTISVGDTLDVKVTVSNTGNMDGLHTVFLFVQQNYRTVVTPEHKMLKAWDKVNLKAGESTTVTLTIQTDQLKFINPENNEAMLEKGTYTLFLGDKEDITTTFTLA